MADLMPKKSYDLTEITRLLLEMRDNCIPKAGDAHDDPKRAEKYEALNAAIDLINNPSMLMKWISVNDRLPPVQGKKVLVANGHGYISVFALWKKEYGNKWTWIDEQGHFKHTNDITHWMPLPEVPKEES
jgi:hypothetical protein